MRNTFKKNIEKKLVELGITGKKKADIVADVFGQQIGTIYESVLIDANDEKSFDAMLETRVIKNLRNEKEND